VSNIIKVLIFFPRHLVNCVSIANKNGWNITTQCSGADICSLDAKVKPA
jgi:hypothetical protein